jgi:hypothetical protein
MRFYSMISVVCLVLLGAIGTSAQEKPSFTGTWKMNLEKSTLSDGKPIPYYTRTAVNGQGKENRSSARMDVNPQ